MAAAVNKVAGSAVGSSPHATALASPTRARARAPARQGSGGAAAARAAGSSGGGGGAGGASSASSTFARDLSSAPRLVQHKNEAKLFYRFLSIGYDVLINPPHWNEPMRLAALAPADLRAGQKVCDVGGGTGFTTIGIVQAGVRPEDITLLDQSPHQLAKAAAKPLLRGVTIVEGDAEALPFETDSHDRYVSAGSIEYWPEPQRGVCEAYRVLKPGGVCCLIGPVHPTHPVSRFFADAWMLFPKEEEYMEWFSKAGFEDVKITRIGPKWYRGVRRHGLIMGCSVTATKPRAGPSPLSLPPSPLESSTRDNSGVLSKLLRTVMGSLAACYYVLVPVYMALKNFVVPEGRPL